MAGGEHPNQRRARFEGLAREELVEPLRRYLARRTDPDTADDVLSETLLVCWRRFDDLPGQPLPWAYGVARRCLANAERSARRQRRLGARLAQEGAASGGGGADQGPGSGRDEVVREALTRLREQDAELLRLWAWEDLGPSEIAQVLDLSANAVSIRLHRARRALREAIGKIEGSAGHGGVEGGGDE